MPATIRLMKFGKRGNPTYRIVVLDKRAKRDGAYIEKIGTYNPHTDPAEIVMNNETFNKWNKRGAVISDGVRKLLKYQKKLASKKA